MKSLLKALLVFTSILSLLIATPCAAQIQVGSATTTKGPGKIKASELAKFKKTTTYFILQKKDYDNVEAFKNAIAKVWTVTPFKIITANEMNKLDYEKSSIFFFGGFNKVREGKSTTQIHTHLSYDLFMLKANKRGKLSQKIFGKFMLHLDSKAYFYVSKFAYASNKKFSNKVITYLYEEASMSNWSPTMIAGYLKQINDGLQKEELRSVFKEHSDKEALSALKNNTLYIPNYVTIKFNKFTGAEKDKDDDDEELKAVYPYDVQYITMEALEEKVAASNQPIYYLSYVKSSTDKYISVFNSKTGAMLCTDYVPVSYNFKFKDLKRIKSKIK